MRIFNEDKTNEIFNPDLSLGKLIVDKLTIHHDAVPAVPEITVEQQAAEWIATGHKKIYDVNGEITYSLNGEVVYDNGKAYKVLEEFPSGGKTVDEILPIPEIPAKEAYDEYEDIYVYIPYTEDELREIENAKLNATYIPSAQTSIAVFAKSYLKANPPQTTEEKMSLSGLYEVWKRGKYEIGDIRNYAGQTWECVQAHDNSVYPDIIPENAQTWATFWKPLHGTTPETARPWVKPQNGTTDMYLIGEHMVFTDGKTYKCLRNTVYSPEEYAADWEVIN